MTKTKEPSYVDQQEIEDQLGELKYIQDHLVCYDTSIGKFRKEDGKYVYVLAICGDTWTVITPKVFNHLKKIAMI